MWRLSILCSLAARFAIGSTYELPAGKILEVRLTRSLASFSSKKGGPAEGVLVAPVSRDHRNLAPMGTRISGTIRDIRRVGLGLIHENARITLGFDTLSLPDGSRIPIATQVVEIDNSRESVDRNGRVNGIRSTGTLGYRANNLLSGVAMFDPIAYLYVNVASARMLRFSEPEIWFPAGTELSVKLVAPVQLTKTFEPPAHALQASGAERAALGSLLRELPYRTATASSNKPSDLTNLVFLGSPAAVERAFHAAGWVQSDELNTGSAFMTMRSIAEDQKYQSAPMSVLLLDEQRPRLTLSKSLDTFSKRHHTRVWQRSETWNGLPVLTASATQDIGIQLSRKNRTFIHVIDTNIDHERTKIVNDLIFTGCVEGAELHNRPWIKPGARNATEEELMTDRRVAVLRINDCLQPRNAIDSPPKRDLPTSGNTIERGFRQGILITRNDLYRGNLIYQGIEGTRFGIRYVKNKGATPQVTSGHAGSDTEGIPIEPDASDLSAETPDEARNRSASVPHANLPEAPVKEKEESPSLFEIGLEGGWLRFASTFDVNDISVVSRTPEVPSFHLFLQNSLKNGWAIGTSVTLNSWRYFSNEFSFDYQRGKYRLGASFTGIPGQQAPFGYQEETTGFLTNQFGYAFLANLRPREKRIRPYLAFGTAFQLLHITDAPFKNSAGIFRVGLKNVGLILAAYNFANEPPLNGGGVFQFGLQYGGGVKYRLSRRWLARLDYRETLSPQPNFAGRSISLDVPSSDEFTITRDTVRPSGPLREQRMTAGFSFVF